MTRTLPAALLALCLALATLPGLAQAQAPITGAFGFELGQAVDLESLEYAQAYEQLDGSVLYDQVAVPQPSATFDIYTLEVDPDDNTVIGIGGFKQGFASEQDLDAAAEALTAALTAQHGPGKENTEAFGYELLRDGKSLVGGKAANMLMVIYSDAEAKAALEAEAKARLEAEEQQAQ